jgi:hypothetical protein
MTKVTKQFVMLVKYEIFNFSLRSRHNVPRHCGAANHSAVVSNFVRSKFRILADPTAKLT